MTSTVAHAIDWDSAPDGLDRIAADLRAMRSAAGDPSYATIGRRVAALRAARGVPEHERGFPRTTLYACFRDGRRRMDADAVVEIALALGLPESLRGRWADRLRAARAAADGAAVAAVRDRIPAPVPSFAGRERELDLVGRMLADGGAVWISGMAGEGKTQLALRFAERSAPDALFLDLRGHDAEAAPVRPAAAQRAVLRQLDADEGGRAEDRRRRVREALAASGRLLVLDDAASGEQVEAILGSEPVARVIVTSREPAAGEWSPIALGGLSSSEAAAVLAAFAPVGEASSEDVTRLTALTGGLPLAVAIVGGRLRSHAGWTLSDHVDLMADRLASARVQDELRRGIELSFAALSADAAALLRAFADLPVAELDVEMSAVLTDLSPVRAAHAADELMRASLVIARDDGTVALHSVVRAFAREQAWETDPPRVREEAFARLGGFLAERAWAAYDAISSDIAEGPIPTEFPYLRGSWTAEEAGSWLESRWTTMLAIAHAAPERGHPQLLFRVAEGLAWWLSVRGYIEDALGLQEAAADVAADAADRDALLRASVSAGRLHAVRDRLDDAMRHLERASDIADAAANPEHAILLGTAENMSALVDLRQGRMDRARERLAHAADLYASQGDDIREMGALINLGVVLHTSGRFAEEDSVIARAVAIAEAHGQELDLGTLIVNRSELHVQTGRYDDALYDAERALEIGIRLASPYMTASAKGTCAEVCRRKGALDEAARHATAALEDAREMGAEFVIADNLLLAARIAADRGRADDATSLLDEADALLASDGDYALRGRLLRLRAELAQDPREREHLLGGALEQFERAGSFHAAELRAR